MYIYIFFMWFGRDPGGWHDGAFGSRRHRPAQVPALIRVMGTTAHPGAVATVPHPGSAVIRAVGTTGLFWHDHHRTTRQIGQEQPWIRPPNGTVTGAAGSRREW
jgi:hypothetical protein